MQYKFKLVPNQLKTWTRKVNPVSATNQQCDFTGEITGIPALARYELPNEKFLEFLHSRFSRAWKVLNMM
jgi:hypothetical protein